LFASIDSPTFCIYVSLFTQPYSLYDTQTRIVLSLESLSNKIISTQQSLSLSLSIHTHHLNPQKALQPQGFSQAQSVRAILLDTKGPEIRTGKLANDVSGHDTITLTKGEKITLFVDANYQQEHGSTTDRLFIDYPSLCKCLIPGRKVLLDDGAIVLTVQSVQADTVTCVMDNTGVLRSRAGVHLPLADTSDLPALSEQDKTDILYGMTIDVDYVAASFVQSAQGVRDIRAHLEACAQKLGWPQERALPKIISKIETAGALQLFDEILAESDGIMVARGDLGVEIPLTQVANAQKEMVAACNAVGKPVSVNQ
jgi:pyruvate kinase